MQRNTPISEVMTTAPQVVGLHHKLSDVRKLLTATRIHHLPVVDGSKLVGLISSNDLIRLEGMLDDTEEAPLRALLDKHYKIRDIMQKDVITVPSTGTVAHAACALSAGGFHAVPVVDDKRNLVGIVTSTDLINYLLEYVLPTPRSRLGALSEDKHARKPGESELRTGVETAERMCDSSGQDPDFIAKALLYFKRRSERLERVFRAAELYLHSGLAEREHTALTRAIDAARHGTFESSRID